MPPPIGGGAVLWARGWNAPESKRRHVGERRGDVANVTHRSRHATSVVLGATMTKHSWTWVRLAWPQVLVGVVAGCSSAQNEVATSSRETDTASDDSTRDAAANDDSARDAAANDAAANGGDAPATLEAFYTEYYALLCEYVKECYGAPELAFCDVDSSPLEAYYGDKVAGLIYHRETAAQCLAHLRNLDCEALDPLTTEACLRIAEGPGRENDTCSGAIDCGLDLYCNDDEQCPGTCKPRAAAGEDCTISPCLEELECANGTCTRRASEGESCSDVGCERELSCLDGVCERYLPYQRKLGESCESNADCYGAERCDLDTKTCERAGREGDECGLTLPCYTFDYYCAESVCRARKANGESCVEPSECSGNACIDGRCQEPRDIGEKCSEPLDCRTVSCGEDGKCSPIGSCE